MDEFDWYEEDMEHLAKAMLKAEEAFQEYFEEQGLDGAYWDLELTGFVCDANFERGKKIEMSFRISEEDKKYDKGGDETL